MRRFTARLAALVAIGAIVGPFAPPSRAQDTGALGTDRLRAAIQRAQAGTDAPLRVSGEHLTASEVDDLVAPVALYPDALLAQVLVAATYPQQIADASQLIAASADMTDSELDSALAEKSWDPSVLVLMSGFPTVVTRMADDPVWTERLGNAMIDQDADVLASVQRMRAQAYGTGVLKSNAAQTVERQDDQIYIRPTDPKVVYVPRYDPQVAFASTSGTPYRTQYGSTYSPPYQTYMAPSTYAAPSGVSTTQTALLSGVIGFGAGLLVDQLFNNDDNDHNKNKNDDWNGYWGRPRPIDWYGRQVYARPNGYWAQGGDGSWNWERDHYWDRKERRWYRDDLARRNYEAERQDTLRWVMPPHNSSSDREWRRELKRAAQEQKAAIKDDRKARAKAEAARQNALIRQDEKARQARQEQRAKDARHEQRVQELLRDRQKQEAKQRAKQVEKKQQAEQAQQQKRAEQRAKEAKQQQKLQDRQDQAAKAARQEQRAKEARREERRKAEAAQQAADQKAEAARQDRRQQKAAAERAAADRKAAQQEEKAKQRAAKRCKAGKQADCPPGQ